MATHVYRGTTSNWPGGLMVRTLGLMSTSTDPVIGTIFAIHCDRFDAGILQIAPLASLDAYISPPNVLVKLEKEVALQLTPGEFTTHVVHTVSAHRAREVLQEMGVEVSPTIFTPRDISDALNHSPRLDDAGIMQFDTMIGAVES